MIDSRFLTCVLVVLILVGCGDYLERDRMLETEDNKYTISHEEFIGTWRIYDYKFAGISGMKKQEAEGYIGSKVTLKFDKASSFEGECSDINYDYVVNNSPGKYFLTNHRIEPQEISFDSEKVHIISANCSEPFFDSMIYDKKDDIFILSWDGVYFFAKRRVWYSWLYSWY